MIWPYCHNSSALQKLNVLVDKKLYHAYMWGGKDAACEKEGSVEEEEGDGGVMEKGEREEEDKRWGIPGWGLMSVRESKGRGDV